MTETVVAKETRLELLSKKKAEIEAKLKAEKERLKKQGRKAKTAENAKARKDDTRRKILLGSFVLAKIKAEGERGSIRSWLEKGLPAFLEKDDDKALLKEFL